VRSVTGPHAVQRHFSVTDRLLTEGITAPAIRRWMVLMSSIPAIITATIAFLALIGGYVQFVLRRALLPCIEFDVEFLPLSRSGWDQPIGEILCRIRNEGPAVGYVTDVRCRIRYRLAGESGERQGEPVFAHSLLPSGEFLHLDQQKRFIQPGVTQWYRKPVALPANTCLIHVWGRFEYEISAGKITGFLARFLGQPYGENPIHYMVRRTFAIDDDTRQKASSVVDTLLR
jgi:hypothetical protein